MGLFDSKSKLLEGFRLDWGKKIVKDRDYKRLHEEYELVKDLDGFYLDDQCWHDMEMDQHFLNMDRSKSYAGSLILYKMLRNLKLDPNKIKNRGKEVEALIGNTAVREELQLAIHPLKFNDLEGMLYFFDRTLVFPKIYHTLAYVLAITPFVLIGAMLWRGAQFLPLFVVNIVVNFIANASFSKYCLVNKGFFYSVRNIVATAAKLGKVHEPALETLLNELKQHAKKCHPIVRKTRGLEMVDNDPIGISVYIDYILMVTMRSFYKVVDHINENQAELREIYKKIGEVDALIAIASYKSSLKEICEPEFVDENKVLSIQEAYQPLIAKSIKNSIDLVKQNIYLTGSNMSGKSTFLRTVGLNILMAQTFNFAFSKSYKASLYKLYSSISRNDDLLAGKSYFLMEAEIVLKMLQNSHDEIPSFIVIDEIFRGTNTKERIQASVGVLNYLSKQNAVVFVATHDLEIKDQIGDSFLNYHFGESVGEQGIVFDYLLKPGNSKIGNALKILKYLGYPDEMFAKEMK